MSYSYDSHVHIHQSFSYYLLRKPCFKPPDLYDQAKILEKIDMYSLILRKLCFLAQPLVFSSCWLLLVGFGLNRPQQIGYTVRISRWIASPIYFECLFPIVKLFKNGEESRDTSNSMRFLSSIFYWMSCKKLHIFLIF